MAFSPVAIDGAEHGVGGLTAILSGGGLYTSAFGSGTVTNQTSVVRSGNYAYRFQTTSTSAILIKSGLTGSSLWEGMFYVRIPSTPSVTTTIFQFSPAADNGNATIRVDTSGRLVGALYDGSTRNPQTGPTMTIGQWYRVDLACDFSSTSWVLQWAVNGATQTNSTFTGPASRTLDRYTVGIHNSATADLYIDDIVVASGSISEHPVGEYHVLPFMPNAVGTHNLEATPSNSFYKDVLGAETALTTGETTSYAALASLPFSSGEDHIVLDPDASLAGTHYVEYGFADATATPLAVRAHAVLFQDSAVADTIVARIREGGTDLDIYNGAINTAARLYKTVTSATKPSGGAWTQSAFNSIALRYGFSTDVDGRVRLHGAMLEAAFTGSEVSRGHMTTLGVG